MPPSVAPLKIPVTKSPIEHEHSVSTIRADSSVNEVAFICSLNVGKSIYDSFYNEERKKCKYNEYHREPHFS